MSTNFRSTQSAGVSKIETDVAAKTVVVEADESVAPQMMLEKLEKVSKRSETSIIPAMRLTFVLFPLFFLDVVE
jgi:hypothetical protein